MPVSLLRRRVLIAALCMAAGGAQALDPRIPLAALHHDAWTSKDGMPGDVWDMAQGADGTMWFATTSGLYRFDGVRFEHLTALGGTALQSNVLASLRAFPDGSLWIGHRYGGIDVWADGRLRQYGAAHGLPASGVRVIQRDRRGGAWAMLADRLVRLDGGQWRAAGASQGLPERLGHMQLDRDGALLVADGATVYRLDEASGRFAPTGIPSTTYGAYFAPDGRTWSGTREGLRRIDGAANARPARDAGMPGARDYLFDRDGNLWAAGEGLNRIRPSALAGKDGVAFADAEKLLASDQVSGAVMTLLEDREGNIWAGTRRGVDRYRNSRLVSLGLPMSYSYITLALDETGTLWATAALQGLWHTWKFGADGPQAQDEQRITSLATGADGALLLGADGYIERRRGKQHSRIPFPASVAPSPDQSAGVRLMLDDGAALWASFTNGQLYRHADGAWRAGAEFGLGDRLPVSIARDRRGALWVGYGGNRIVTLKDGKTRAYGGADGLDIGIVSALQDVGGVMLAGGDRGLAMLAGGRFVRVGAPDAEALAGVTGIVQTADGDLWLNASKGLVHIGAAAWNAWRARPGANLAFEVFDALDGYPGIAHLRAAQPGLLLDRAGRLLVAATDGAAWIEPLRLERNRIAPPVRIGALSSGGKRYGLPASLELPPGTRALQIDYSAASYTMPERVRFRYRLVGMDSEWMDPGTRRSAFYNNLAPGGYRFEVTAANEDGVWNPQPAAYAFTILPTFWQTAFFKFLCGAALLLAAWLLHRLRLRRATARLRALLQERADERERIARTLHDTLMQSVQALLMLFGQARDKLPPDSDARPLLDRTLQQAHHALEEGRDELAALRGAAAPQQDLAGTLAPLGHILAEQFGVRFDSSVHGQARTLRAEVAVEVCFIAREALQNAFRHAHASAVGLELRFDERDFYLRVRDDGRGMPTGAAKPGHWGLPGMRERAAAIGAHLHFAPAGDGGTLVELRLDAARAYERPLPRRPFWSRLLPAMAGRG